MTSRSSEIQKHCTILIAMLLILAPACGRGESRCVLDPDLFQKKGACIGWSSRGHTDQPVPILSFGPDKYTGSLGGDIGNTEIAPVIRKALREGMSVILVIGDGMGSGQMLLPVLTGKEAEKGDTAIFRKMLSEGTTGCCSTESFGGAVTDSAAAGTAIACGVKTLNGRIGMDWKKKSCLSVLEEAKRLGYATGIITDTRITHATPACFYAHISGRDEEERIAEMLAESGIDVIMGGGASFFIPKMTRVKDNPDFRKLASPLDGPSRRHDGKDLAAAMKARGYTVVCTKRDLRGTVITKLLGLFSASHMNAPIDRDDEDTGEPSIPEMASAALSIISEKGPFFLMIECGRIDHESHDHDAGSVMNAVGEMYALLGECRRFMERRRGKVLLVVTADHETGGLKPGSCDISGSISPGMLRSLIGQKRSLRAITAGAGSATEFRTLYRTNVPLPLTTEAADILFSRLSKKYKD